jgi:hypothetical protein
MCFEQQSRAATEKESPMKGRKFSYQIANRIPWTGTRDGFSESITKELLAGFRRELTRDELCLFDAAVNKQKPADVESAALAAIFAKLDDFILDQTRTVGWRMTLSPLVSMRFNQWELSRDCKRFTEFGRAMANAVKVIDRKQKPRISDPEWYTFHQQTVQELDLLLRKFRTFAQSARLVDAQVFSDWVKVHIEANAEILPCLAKNRESLVEFIISTGRPVLALVIERPNPSPSAFFCDWFGSAMGIEPEQLRQKISLLGKQRAGNRS